ncbi:MAG: hypothetical protein R3C28_09760 [Pirellulaceae bacterium]
MPSKFSSSLTPCTLPVIQRPAPRLDQAGLRDGGEIVVDYLFHGEAGVAFDHLLYMISEPDLVLSAGTYAELARAGEMLELPEDALASIRRAAGG